MNKVFFVCACLVALGAGCKNPNLETSVNIPSETNNTVYCSASGEVVANPVQQSDRSYCLQTQKNELELNVPTDYSFTILDDRGEKLKNLEIVHEKIMHVIIVRDDLTQFQHVHPEFDSQTGIFTLKNLTLRTEGNYIMYFDFTPSETKNSVVRTEKFVVGQSTSEPLVNITDFSKIQTVDKFKVTLDDGNKKIMSGQDTKLNFKVEAKSGVPIEHVERYLGEFGHLVIIQEGSYAYIHAHPPAKSLTNLYNNIPFSVNFPSEGTYKMFLEFKYAGKVYRAEYATKVEKGQNSPEALPMDHTGHTMSH